MKMLELHYHYHYLGSAPGPHWGTSVPRTPDKSLSTLPQPLWAGDTTVPNRSMTQSKSLVFKIR